MSQRQQVVEACKKVFSSQDISLIKKLKSEIVTKGGMSIKEFQSFRIRPVSLDCLDTQRLYFVAQAIDSVLPGVYNLTEKLRGEINADSLSDKDEGGSEALSFRNAFVLADEQWSGVVSVAQLARLIQSHKVSLCNSDGVDSKTADLIFTLVPNSARANVISELISADSFKFNTIRLNVVNNSGSQSPYISDGYLIIPDGQAVIIPDGYTRAAACEIAYFNHPELRSMFNNRFFNVIVTYLNVEDTRRLIAQEWHREEVSKIMREGMEHGAAHTIIYRIADSDRTEAKCRQQLVIPEVEAAVAKSLDRYMYTSRIKTESQIVSVANWMATYYSFVSEKFPEAFQEANSWAWYAVTCYASMIRGDKNWQQLTEIGVPLIGLDNMPISKDTEETEIEILKRCKGACCTSVEQSKEREIR
ncbi:MAG: hypothetical protein ACI4WS_12910 [Oscillospiraceae bacterium]